MIRTSKPSDPSLPESLHEAVEFTNALSDDVQAKIASTLAKISLLPFWAPGLTRETIPGSIRFRDENGRELAIVDDELVNLVEDRGLLATKPSQWDSRILDLWHRGVVFLADECSELSPHVRIREAGVILIRSVVEAGCVLREGSILCEDVRAHTRATIYGDSCLVETFVMEQVVVKRVICDGANINWSTVVEEARIGAGTVIAPQTCLIGVSHPNFSPTAGAEAWGVVIGSNCTIGGQALILPGARIGDGAVVAGQAMVTSKVASHCLFIRAGLPEVPVDYQLRSLSWTEAFDAGMANASLFAGQMGCVDSPFKIGLLTDGVLVVDHPSHPYLNERLSAKTLRYQEGALVGFLSRRYTVVSSCVWVGASVRFEFCLEARADAAEIAVGPPGSLTATIQEALTNPGNFPALPVRTSDAFLLTDSSSDTPDPVANRASTSGASTAAALREVLDFLEEITGQAASAEVSSESTLVDLGLNSLGFVVLIDALQERLNRSLLEEDTQGLTTVADLCALFVEGD